MFNVECDWSGLIQHSTFNIEHSSLSLLNPLLCFTCGVTARLTTWIATFGSLAVVTAAGRAINLNPSTIGFAYLIVVLLISVRGGLLIGTVSSVLATLCYNFFFFPPLYTLTIEQPANWFALAAFLVASVTVNRLVVAARVQAEKAEHRGQELETLYAERERFMEENAHVQALRESESLKTSLLRAISHDLTTPITAVTIRTESIRRRAGTDSELIDDVAAIAEETARLRRRIDNLLAMARLEAGKAKPHREPTPPADLFRATRENLPIVFSARPIMVHVDADCPDANVDPSLALEILVNLLENAHRVSPAGATIELAAQTHPLDPGKLRIEILDRGPGLPPGVADADGNVITETTDVAQRGLGLEIARSLAAANGGSIGLAPRPGGGTIARIDLPIAVLGAEPS
jgi:K+-sensing histidine kinase KdpD